MPLQGLGHYETHLDGIKSLDAGMCGMKTAQLRHKVTGCFLHYVSSWHLYHNIFKGNFCRFK